MSRPSWLKLLYRFLSPPPTRRSRDRRRSGLSLRVEALEDRTALATFTVSNILDSGLGSLRDAITRTNSSSDPSNTIQFNIPGSGVHTINPLSALPTITRPALIDGYTQAGSSPNTLAIHDNAVLTIELNGAGAGATARACD
jgi:hypothetical protein